MTTRDEAAAHSALDLLGQANARLRELRTMIAGLEVTSAALNALAETAATLEGEITERRDQIEAIVQDNIPAHEWSGTSLRLRNVDGEWGVFVQLLGPQGPGGWTALMAAVPDGVRVVRQVIDWFGGSGAKPAVGMYEGAFGFVTEPFNATNFRGVPGPALTLNVGAVQAVAQEDAAVRVLPTSEEHVRELEFDLPKGDPPEISIGTIATGAYDSVASLAVRAGSPSGFPILDGSIPRGVPGNTYETYGVSIYNAAGVPIGSYYADRSAPAVGTISRIYIEMVAGSAGATATLYLGVGSAVLGPYVVTYGTPILLTGLSISVAIGAPVTWSIDAKTGTVTEVFAKGYGAIGS